jgi:F0F1-type ATP synthase membrane subunit c/vacuolar-type H+-ATPase subunit K
MVCLAGVGGGAGAGLFGTGTATATATDRYGRLEMVGTVRYVLAVCTVYVMYVLH